MNGAAPPSRERVLRSLFWTLLFRGRAAQQMGQQRRRRQVGLTLTLLGYTLFGAIPGLLAFVSEPLAYASYLHAYTLLFASLTLAGSAGSLLFVREEPEILLHRPVLPAELLRAKAFVLAAFALLLALALNAVGLITGLWNPGNAWWFPFAHVLVTVLVMVFSCASVVLVYNLCLRWFGRERFENLLTLVQVALSVLMIVGTQLLPRMLENEELRQLDLGQPWVLWLPPVWFGALDALLCAAAPVERIWLPATLAVVATALSAWLGFCRLASAYGAGLQALGESQAPDRPRRRLLSWVVKSPPLRWWLPDPLQREGFLLASAYLVRDRETKMKIYPALAPMLVMPVVLGIGSGRSRGDGFAGFVDAMVAGYAAMVVVQALLLLRHSEQWRTAELYAFTPLPHWAPLFHGARKAVLCWLGWPAVLLLGCAMAGMRGDVTPLSWMLPNAICVLACSSIPGLSGDWLPLSRPPDHQRDASAGCLWFGGAMAAAMAVGGLSRWMHALGWFWPFVAVLFVLAVALEWGLARTMARRRWRVGQD